MFIMAAGIVATGNDAVVLMIPSAIIVTDFLLLPTFVLAIVMAIVAAVFIRSLVLAIIVMLIAAVVAMIVAVLGRGSNRDGAGQRAQSSPQN
jgi:hypothetical protein